MNRILFDSSDLAGDRRLVLRDRRARHVIQVLRAVPGDTLRVGRIDGLIGTGRVVAITDDEVCLEIALDGDAPAPWIDLLLALPRPKVLKRLWAQMAALGIGRIILINAQRVERCYFDTHWLTPEAYTPLLIEGLEQSGATHVPEVWLRRAFKPFVEDELPRHYGDSLKLLAHPVQCPHEAPLLHLLPHATSRPLLAIGPEGGWSDYELEHLEAQGFSRLSLGPRTLRTDTACIALLGRLMPVLAEP